jgi:hypothetical protein
MPINPVIWEAEAGGSQVQKQSAQSYWYPSPSQKKKKKVGRDGDIVQVVEYLI